MLFLRKQRDYRGKVLASALSGECFLRKEARREPGTQNGLSLWDWPLSAAIIDYNITVPRFKRIEVLMSLLILLVVGWAFDTQQLMVVMQRECDIVWWGNRA